MVVCCIRAIVKATFSGIIKKILRTPLSLDCVAYRKFYLNTLYVFMLHAQSRKGF